MSSQLEYKALMQRLQHLVDIQRYEDAKDGLEQLLKNRRNDPHAMWILVNVNWRLGSRDGAITLLKRFIKLNPRHDKAPLLLSNYLAERGRFQEAISILKRLQRKHPGQHLIAYTFAQVHELQGETDLAVEALKPILESGRMDLDTARLHAELLIQKGQNQEAVDHLKPILESSDVPSNVRKRMLFLQGKAYEILEEIESSYEAYTQANQVNEGSFDKAEYVAITSRIIEVFSSDLLKTLPRSGIESCKPVFIISRPRAGSTLVERIIGAHPDSHAAGEIGILPGFFKAPEMRFSTTKTFPDCIPDLSATDFEQCAQDYLAAINDLNKRVKRVTDKTLSLQLYLGLIPLLFPNASLIDLRRNPLDNCLACWTVDLAAHFGGSSQLEHLAIEYREHIRLMEHWHRVLETPIMRLNYEDLVDDPDTWSRKIIDFIGLPFHDACLEFHGAGKKRQQHKISAAPTLSHSQVNKPIYTSSVGRARRFNAYLDPVREVLNLAPDAAPLGHEMRI